MSCLLIESIFKVKQDSDLPAYYGNNVFYRQNALRPIEHFSFEFFGCEGQLDEWKDSWAKVTWGVNEDLCFHLFVMSAF